MYLWTAMIVMCAVIVHAAPQPSACVRCHEFVDAELGKPVSEWRDSIHQENGITCEACHGGNPDVDVRHIEHPASGEFEKMMSQAMSASRGFVGKPAGKEQFDLCGRCHGDSVDRYAKSIMGRAYLENKGGPSCVACHHAHRNTMPEVPKDCERCHKDTTAFDRIDPMNVTASTVQALSGMRIELAQAKTIGRKLPEFPEDLGAFQIGFVVFLAVFILFGIGWLILLVLERRQ